MGGRRYLEFQYRPRLLMEGRTYLPCNGAPPPHRSRSLSQYEQTLDGGLPQRAVDRIAYLTTACGNRDVKSGHIT